MVERGSGGGTSLSLSLWELCEGEPGRRVPLLGTLEDKQVRLLRWASLLMGALLGNLEGGSSTRNFERWMKGTLGMERLSLSLSLKKLSVEGL